LITSAVLKSYGGQIKFVMTKRQYKHELLVTFYGNAKVRSAHAREHKAVAGCSAVAQQKNEQLDVVYPTYFVSNKGTLQSVVAGIKKQLIIVANVLLDSVTEFEQG